MSHVLRSRAPTGEDANEVVASLGRKALKFVAWPFGIVLAMRPQREREAAKIAAEFHRDRYADKADI
jgi:hypothetical protein